MTVNAREIVVADRKRREARAAIELAQLAGIAYPAYDESPELRHAMMIRADAKANGMVTALTTRVTAPWATMRTGAGNHTVGTADNATQSVKVTLTDGTSYIAPVSAFRAAKSSKRRAAKTQSPTLHSRVIPSHSLADSECASQAPIGNVE